MKLNYVALILLFSLLYCCSNHRNAAKKNDFDKMKYHRAKNAILGDISIQSLPTTIYHVKLSENILELSIGYTGGCTQHQFDLVGNEMISKSLPPIRSINLIHKTNEEESCKRTMYDTLYFDISNLAYQKSIGSVIKLNLAGWKEQITYTFE